MNALHQRRLPRAGFSGKANDLSRMQIKVHILEGRDFFIVQDVHMKVLMHVADF